MRFYGVDLRDPTLGVRRVGVLVRGLPRDSATVRDSQPDGTAEWSMEAELLASLIEVVDGASWRAVMPHASKRWKPPKPLKVPRPGVPAKPERRQATAADLVELFGPDVVRPVPKKGGDDA